MGSPLRDTLKNKADTQVDIVNHSVDVSNYTETGLKQLEMLQQILAFKEQCKDIPLGFNTKALEVLLCTMDKIKETFIDLPKLLVEINNKGILLSGCGIEDVKKDIQNLDNIINNLGKDGIFGDKAIEEASKFASILDSVKIKIDTIKSITPNWPISLFPIRRITISTNMYINIDLKKVINILCTSLNFDFYFIFYKI